MVDDDDDDVVLGSLLIDLIPLFPFRPARRRHFYLFLSHLVPIGA